MIKKETMSTIEGILINKDKWSKVRIMRNNAREVISFLQRNNIKFIVDIMNSFIFDVESKEFIIDNDDMIIIHSEINGMSMHRIIEKIKNDRKNKE